MYLVTLVARAWRAYRSRGTALIGSFTIVYFTLFLAAQILVVDMPRWGLALSFYAVTFVLPVILGGILFALAARIYAAPADTSVRTEIPHLRPYLRDLLSAGLLASLLALSAFILLGPLGLLVQPLVLGPPVVVQAIALEGDRMRDALIRARVLFAGRWARVMLYLLSASLGIGLLSAATVTVIDQLTRSMGDAARVVVLVFAQGFAWGISMPYMAAMSYEVYRGLTVESDEPETAPPAEGGPFTDPTRG